MNYTDYLIGKLTDAYAKDKNSNNYKLFSIFGPELDEISAMFEAMKQALDIDLAFGVTLDKIASNVNQVRGNTTDAVLRILIKAKIAADQSDATIRAILDVISFILGDYENTSQLNELFDDTDNPEPAAFQIVAPIDGILGSGMTANQFILLLQRIRAGGVRILANLEGTFEFGEIDEYGPEYENGFSHEDMSDGGTLGILFEPDVDDPLPI